MSKSSIERLVELTEEFERIEEKAEFDEIVAGYNSLRSLGCDWVALYNTADPDVENWKNVPVLAVDETAAIERLAAFGYDAPDFLVHFVEWEFGWSREF